jgi:hypothetical protein
MACFRVGFINERFRSGPSGGTKSRPTPEAFRNWFDDPMINGGQDTALPIACSDADRARL